MSNSDEKRLLVNSNKGKPGMYHLTALSPRDLSEISEDCFDLPFSNPKELIGSNSCGGLLFFYDDSGHSYLCNPTTKQIQFFPPKEASQNPNYDTRLAGACVGYDSKSNDYKILRIWDRKYWPSRTRSKERSFELYSLSSDSWDEISSDDAPKCTSGIENVIYARAKFYWISVRDSRVVSFDCSKKSFSYLSLPRKADDSYFNLVKFNDDDSLGIAFCGPRGANHKVPLHLAFGGEPGFYFEVWVWREKWDKMFNVSLGGAVTGAETIYAPFLFLHGMMEDDNLDRLVVYDWTKKECKELGIYNSDTAINVFCYVESNVALPRGKPINGSSPILNYGDLEDEYDSSNEDYGDLEDEYDSSNEAREADPNDFDFDYDTNDEGHEANLDDFAVNGFHVVNDIELEEEEVVTHGNRPYASGDEYNRVDFPVDYTNAKFFVIKSDSEDDVRKIMKCKKWSCSPYGNKKLNAAYEDAKRVAATDSRGCPILLFFTVNASGRLCGVAEMSGPVRYKRSGNFHVKWHIIKDLSNSNFSRKVLQNMTVTDSRDIQRISYRKGKEMLEIFMAHKQCRKRARRRV
ncbi:uncharacterized protein LOC131000253 [Salvia miltiorrhiza]|uniref:uncharacterized protein LOC131000253 n=1 Tax=Salvia miltiorrhiza TaxID=226208 RepID=UPI0025ABA269|nr:uncharacterized protein LOC131000253 [Salvia miltiorrhiza]